MARYQLPIPSIAGTLVLTTTSAAFAATAEPATAQPTATTETQPAVGAGLSTGVDTSTSQTATAPVANPPTTTVEVPDPPLAPAPVEAGAAAPQAAPAQPAEPAPLATPYAPVEVRVEAKPEQPPHGHAVVLLPAKTKRRYIELNAGSVYSLGGFSGPFGGQGFQLEQVFGRYVGKSKTDGLGVGFTVIERFGTYNDYTFGARFQWDKPLAENLGIYISNGFTLGFNLLTYGSGGYYSYGGIGVAGFGIDMAYNLGAKIVVKDRLILSFRPVNLDFNYIVPVAFRVRWSVMGGLGFSW